MKLLLPRALLLPLTEAQLAAKGYGFGIGVDGDIIVMTPDAPLTDVLYSPAAFHCRTWGPCPECIGRGGSQPNHGPNCTGNLSRCNGGQPGHGRCADNSGAPLLLTLSLLLRGWLMLRRVSRRVVKARLYA